MTIIYEYDWEIRCTTTALLKLSNKRLLGFHTDTTKHGSSHAEIILLVIVAALAPGMLHYSTQFLRHILATYVFSAHEMAKYTAPLYMSTSAVVMGTSFQHRDI